MALRIRGVGCAALIVALFVLAGCGKRTANVSGLVTFNEKVVTSGTVTFFTSGGEPVAATISPEGWYELDSLVAGECIVTVIQPDPNSSGSGDGGDDKKKKKDTAKEPPKPSTGLLPPAYSDTATSPLKFNVKGGKQVINLILVKE